MWDVAESVRPPRSRVTPGPGPPGPRPCAPVTVRRADERYCDVTTSAEAPFWCNRGRNRARGGTDAPKQGTIGREGPWGW